MATTRKSKPKSADTEAQTDPKAPLDSAALLKAATPVLKNLAADLLNRADNSPSIKAALQARHTADKAQERTADNYDTWRRPIPSCVFVRTLEDRSLIDRNRLAGPGAEAAFDGNLTSSLGFVGRCGVVKAKRAAARHSIAFGRVGQTVHQEMLLRIATSQERARTTSSGRTYVTPPV
jgi:hypothetical protein